MRWLSLLVALSACRTLAPPPEDLDAYCRSVLRERPWPVSPECMETAGSIIAEGAAGPRPPETLASCMEKASEWAAKCRLSASIGHVGPGLIEAVSGVPAKHSEADDAAYCEQQMQNTWAICRARHGDH